MKAVRKIVAGPIVAAGPRDGTATAAAAADEPIVVVVRLFPSEGREDEAQAQPAKLADFVPKTNPAATFRLHRATKGTAAFLRHETFPSQATLDNQPKSVLPVFTQQFGPAPQGLVAKPNEVEF